MPKESHGAGWACWQEKLEGRAVPVIGPTIKNDHLFLKPFPGILMMLLHLMLKTIVWGSYASFIFLIRKLEIKEVK